MNNDKWYNSKRWKEKRAHILRRDGYMDQLEKRAGRTIEANTVHHILPREQYPQYAWEDWNLISVSDKTHRFELHDMYGGLTEAGRMLMLETAHKHDIKLSQLTLVIGLPGSGKTTIAKTILKNGLCYDLDYIAGAFRLNKPKAEDNKPARKMANSMVKAFAINARRYSSRVIVIRTAPTIDEVTSIEPDHIIVCENQYKPTRYGKEQGQLSKIEEIKGWAKDNRIPIEVITGTN